jgi:2-iminobutanoate/2-iminopropanoate deaminase
MTIKQPITYPGHQAGLGGRSWSPALRVGPWVFMSGITSVDYRQQTTVGVTAPPSPMTPALKDPHAQWHQVLTNIKTVITSAGGSMDDIVMANIFVTDMQVYIAYESIRSEYFSEPYPVSTAVEVNRLVHPDWLLEIECLAYIEREHDPALAHTK